jgi:acyl-CoA thioesterase-1
VLRLRLALLPFLLVQACGSEPEPPQDVVEPLAIPDDAPRVVFLGDSITAAMQLPRDQAFPAVLQRWLAAKGLPFNLVNAGVSGDTTAGGLARLDWLLKQKPAVVVVALGGNDGLRGTPLETIERNLRALVERSRAAGARVLLLGVLIPPNYGPEYASGFEAIYERLGAEPSVSYVPFFMRGVGGVPEMNLPDGLHPTPAGHEKLAENILPALVELLRQ